MPELATAWVTLAVSADGMRRDIRRAFNDVDGDRAGRRVGDQFSRGAAAATNLTAVERKLAEAGQRGAAAMGKALKVGAVAAAGTITAALGTSLKLGFDRLTAIDDARSKLTGLGHTTESTAKIMDSALASVKGTAYGLGDAATIAAGAVAAGVKPGRELTAYLKMTADAAAIAGSGLGEMGSILNKVRTGQRAYTDDLNMLADRGIPIYQWVAAEAGVAADEVKKLAEKGQISSAMFENAITKNIGGAALKMGDSFKGAFSNMTAALGRLGAAAEGPTFERLRDGFNTVTKAIDTVTPRVQEMAKQFDANLFNEWIPAARDAWRALQSDPTVRANLTEVRSIFASLADTARQAWPALSQIGASLGQASAALGVSTWRLLVTALEAAAGILNSLLGPLQTLAGLMRDHQAVVTTAAGAWALFRTVPALLGKITPAVTPVAGAISTLGQQMQTARTGLADFGGAYRTSVQWMRQGNPTLSTTGAHLRVLGVNAGAAASGGLSMLKNAAGGVVGALGGPLSAALIAAGAAFAIISAQNQKSAQSLKAYQDAVAATGKAQTALNEALLNSRGAFDDTVKSTAVDRIRAISDELDTASQRTGSFLDQFRDSNHSLWGGLGKQLLRNPFTVTAADSNYKMMIDQQADAAGEAKAALDGLKMTQESLTDVVYGGQASFDILAGKLDRAGDAGKQTADKLREARTEFQRQQEVAQRVAPGIHQMAEAMRVFADNTATAADKSRALNTALDALNPARTAGDAQAAHTETLQRIAESANTPADASGGIGAALFQAGGAIDTAKVNGAELHRTLKSIVDATGDVAASGGDMAAALAGDEAQFAALAGRYQTSIDQIKAAAKTLGYTDATLIIKAAGENETTQAIANVARAFENMPTEASVEVKTSDVTAAENALKGFGIEFDKVDQLNGVTQITVKDEAGREKLRELANQILNLPSKKAVEIRIKAALEGDFSRPEVQQAQRDLLLEAFGKQSDGAIVAMATGGLRVIAKPQTAGLYAGRGAGTIFAEQETGGEAYIPLAPAKRGRSKRILAEVARLFGMNVMADGGITIDELKQYASQISGGSYVRGGAPNLDGTDCCLVPDTMVWGPNGPKPIIDIRPGDSVFSYEDGKLTVNKVSARWFSKRQETFEVRTNRRAITGSANHPFLTLSMVERDTRRKCARRDWHELRALLAARGMTSKELSELSKVGRPDISSALNGKRSVSHSVLQRIAAALGVPTEELDRDGTLTTRPATPARYDVRWKRLDELQRGDLLIQPKDVRPDFVSNTLPSGRPMSLNEAWLLGLIVGDGNVGDGHLGICVFGDLRDRATPIVEEMAHVGRSRPCEGKAHWSDSCGLRVSSVAFARELTTAGFRDLQHNRSIPECVWGWDADRQRAFLNGYCDADGHHPANQIRHGERTYSSVSRRLIDDVRTLHIALGDPVTNITVNHRTKPITIKGKHVQTARPLYTFGVSARPDSNGGVSQQIVRPGIREWIEANDFTIAPVLKITPRGALDTYDIEVEGAHNFIADGVVVHNSGAQSAIANFITGGTGRFGTGDEAAALLSRGFQTGDPPAGIAAYWVGWRNGGPGGGHTAGTIVDPLGGNVNVEMGGRSGGGQYGGGAAGASEFPNRAWIALSGGDDPSAASTFGSSSARSEQASLSRATAAVSRAQSALDASNAELDKLNAEGASAEKVTAAEKKRAAAQDKLDAAQEKQTDAETRLAEVKDKAAEQATKSGGGDASSFGQSLFSGILQGMGLDGSVFSNPFDWPNVKSAFALANWGGGLLKNAISPDDSSTAGGGGLGDVGLPNVTDFLKPITAQPLVPNQPAAAHTGSGTPPGPTYQVNGNIGMDPRAVTQRFDSAHNQAYRRNMPAVRPA